MKKGCIIAIALCLLLGGVMAWFLYDRITMRQETEDELQTLKRVRAHFGDALADEEKTIFVNDSAIAGFEEAAKADITEDMAQYISPEGIRFRSLSTAWNASDLQLLYGELLQNKHGEEIYTLAEVIVHPEPDDYAAASHGTESYSYHLRLVFPSLPGEEVFTFTRNGGVIRLYDGDANDDVASMAASLSHEYGHHYTLHYMLTSERGHMVYFNTEYGRLRQLDVDLVRLSPDSTQDYYDNHHWFYYEIAAEDYVTLMGSPNSRSVADYYDIREALDGREDEMTYGKNMDVQENLMIPMATQVEGLAEYFYGFINAPAPTYEPQEITIEMEKDSVSYHLETGYKTFRSYHFTWNKAYGEDAVYTLVCFDPENYTETRYPIRTVTEGEEACAVIGQLARKEGNMVYYYDDKLAEGTLHFVVTVILPDGTMYCSAPFICTF